jgi:hypothetical protein
MTRATGHSKPQAIFFVAFILALAILSTQRWRAAAQSTQTLTSIPSPSAAAAQRTPVLVELFTSEGCSSCPPADALLARLDMQQPVPGVHVIGLEHHVDYWDDQGWPDPFASKAETQRQKDYAFYLHADVYTPQMIVDGRTEILGSDESKATRTIEEAEKAPKAIISISWEDDRSPQFPWLKVHVGKLPADPEAAQAKSTPLKNVEVLLAVTESRLRSAVRRGENAGRDLEHDGVVRQLVRLGQATVGAETSFRTETPVKLGKDWKRENLRAVVFLQDPHTRQIFGSTEIPF